MLLQLRVLLLMLARGLGALLPMLLQLLLAHLLLRLARLLCVSRFHTSTVTRVLQLQL
jgi:hypothetical protein